MKRFAYNDVQALYALLENRTKRSNAEISGRVASIIARVAEGGDAAVRAVTEETDGVSLGALELSAAELDRRRFAKRWKKLRRTSAAIMKNRKAKVMSCVSRAACSAASSARSGASACTSRAARLRIRLRC